MRTGSVRHCVCSKTRKKGSLSVTTRKPAGSLFKKHLQSTALPRNIEIVASVTRGPTTDDRLYALVPSGHARHLWLPRPQYGRTMPVWVRTVGTKNIIIIRYGTPSSRHIQLELSRALVRRSMVLGFPRAERFCLTTHSPSFAMPSQFGTFQTASPLRPTRLHNCG